MSARRKGDIEKVIDTAKDAAWFESHISEAIRDFYYTNYQAETTEQIAKCGQNSFIAACTFARRQCIARDDLLTFTPHQFGGYVAQNESYDKNKVEIVCRVYLDLCFLYDKAPSLYGFAELTGIDRVTLHEWIKEGEGVSMQRRANTPKRSVQKIQQARAESLQNLAITGGKPALGSIACLNNSEWREKHEEAPKMHVLTADELPRLDINGDWQNVERSAEALPDLSNYKI